MFLFSFGSQAIQFVLENGIRRNCDSKNFMDRFVASLQTRRDIKQLITI